MILEMYTFLFHFGYNSFHLVIIHSFGYISFVIQLFHFGNFFSENKSLQTCFLNELSLTLPTIKICSFHVEIQALRIARTNAAASNKINN